MYSLSVCHVLFCMILHLQTPVVYMQSLTLTVQTSPLKSKHEVKLKCLYSEPTCCTATARVWTRDGTQIMNNGAPSDNTKYAEERNDASHYFDMKILNLEDSDFGKVFQCQYNFLTSNSITLIKDDDYEFVPDEYNCTFERKRDGTKMMVGGTFFMKKAAPLPLVYAFYGETNLTIGVSTSMENNFDTWYYRSTFVFKYLVDCLLRNGKSFKVISVTGTSSVELCEKNLCECPKCGLYCWLISLILPVTGVVIFLVVHCIYCCCPQFGEGSACSGRCAILALMLLSLTFSLSTILTLPIGIVVCPCNEGWYQFWNTSWGLLTCHIAIMWIDLSFMKFDWNYLQKNYKTVFVVGIILGNIPLLILSIHDRKSYKGLCDCSLKLCLRSAGIAMLILLILPIPFMIIYFYCLKGRR